MKKIREELDNVSSQIESLENLALLLEDYFYNTHGDKEFNKNLSLSTVVVEKIQSLDESIQNLYHKTQEIEANNQ